MRVLCHVMSCRVFPCHVMSYPCPSCIPIQSISSHLISSAWIDAGIVTPAGCTPVHVDLARHVRVDPSFWDILNECRLHARSLICLPDRGSGTFNSRDTHPPRQVASCSRDVWCCCACCENERRMYAAIQ